MKAIWTDGMGIPTTVIDIRADYDTRSVSVDADNLRAMATGVLEAKVLGEDESQAWASAILETKPGPDGRYDVTEANGGFARWMDAVTDRR